MNTLSLMEFVKSQQYWNSAELPTGFKYYCVNGTKKWYSHGDLNDDDRVFLVVAPNKQAALAWAQYTYLGNSDSSFESYEELTNHIKEYTVDSNHHEYPNLDGYMDVGDFQYRSINSATRISKKEAETLKKYDAYYSSNYY